jgi:hypothetical protein
VERDRRVAFAGSGNPARAYGINHYIRGKQWQRRKEAPRARKKSQAFCLRQRRKARKKKRKVSCLPWASFEERVDDAKEDSQDRSSSFLFKYNSKLRNTLSFFLDTVF